jgi:NitT/TauT family transport system substrate-binding protein
MIIFKIFHQLLLLSIITLKRFKKNHSGDIMKRITFIVYSLFFIFTLSAGGQKDADVKVIRIGVLPDACTLPLFLMDGVEVVPFMSARERETALQLGELDGVTTDLVSVVANEQKGMPQKVLTVTETRFILVANPEMTEDAAWSIGISENTIIEFMVDQFTVGRDIEKVAIPQVPVRMEMLRNGKIPMACLTDALAWPLLGNGFKILADQKDSGLEPAVLAFSEKFLKENPSVPESFKEGWNSAVEEINSNPDKYRSMLLEKVRLPDDPDFPFPVPLYHSVKLPDEHTVQTVLDWFEKKYGLDHAVSYDDLMIY